MQVKKIKRLLPRKVKPRFCYKIKFTMLMNLHFWFISFNVPQRGLPIHVQEFHPTIQDLIRIWFYIFKKFIWQIPTNFTDIILWIFCCLEPSSPTCSLTSGLPLTWTPSWHLSRNNTSAVTYVMLRTTQALNYRGWRFPLHPHSQCNLKNKITEWQPERVVKLLKKPFLKVHLALMNREIILSTA